MCARKCRAASGCANRGSANGCGVCAERAWELSERRVRGTRVSVWAQGARCASRAACVRVSAAPCVSLSVSVCACARTGGSSPRGADAAAPARSGAIKLLGGERGRAAAAGCSSSLGPAPPAPARSGVPRQRSGCAVPARSPPAPGAPLCPGQRRSRTRGSRARSRARRGWSRGEGRGCPRSRG